MKVNQIIAENKLVEFKTQKAAKDAWKFIKPKIENRSNQMRIVDYSKKEFLNGELEKKQIIIKQEGFYYGWICFF